MEEKFINLIMVAIVNVLNFSQENFAKFQFLVTLMIKTVKMKDKFRDLNLTIVALAIVLKISQGNIAKFQFLVTLMIKTV